MEALATLGSQPVTQIIFARARTASGRAQVWSFDSKTGLPAQIEFNLAAEIGQMRSPRRDSELSPIITPVSGVLYPFGISARIPGSPLPETDHRLICGRKCDRVVKSNRRRQAVHSENDPTCDLRRTRSNSSALSCCLAARASTRALVGVRPASSPHRTRPTILWAWIPMPRITASILTM